MESYHFDKFSITLDKEGSPEFLKVSYPVRYGRYAEITTPSYIFQLNLNGEIKYVQGRDHHWPHPAEWLKRTMADDWIYYSAGDYKGIYDLFGEYYFPCLSYPSNSVMGESPFEDQAIKAALKAWQDLQRSVEGLLSKSLPQDLRDFLINVAENDAETLRLRSRKLHDLIGGPVSVLPPDSRHVDYEVIPVIVADGCLYNCGFCRVKSFQDFSRRSRGNILEQIKNLKQFYVRDLLNYNAVFLGHHDALGAGQEILEFAAIEAYERFEFEHSYLRGASLFLFGSVDSLIGSKEGMFETLNKLPFSTYINIGLESADPDTLAVLQKPVTAEKIRDAFEKMTAINRAYEKIEITSNFVFSEDLPLNHFLSFVALTAGKPGYPCTKGCVYLSPLVNGGPENAMLRRKMLRKFYELKTRSRLPTFLYLIQRL